MYRPLSALFILLLVGLPATPRAATVSLTNLPAGASSCTYTGISGDGSGNVTYECASSTQPSAGTLSLGFAPNAATSIVTGSGTTTIQLRRTGATTGGGTASGTVSVAGGCTLNPSGGSKTYADAENRTDTYTVAAGSAAGGTSCTVSLSSVSGAAAGTSSLTISVTTTPPPPPSGCSAFTGRTITWAGSQFKVDPFAPGTPLAIEVDTSTHPLLSTSKFYSFGATLTSGNDLSKIPEAVEASFSLCPGDFTGPATYGPLCGSHTAPSSTAVFNLKAAVGRTLSTWDASRMCGLPATTKFYLNLRLTKRDGSGASSCPGPNCPMFLNISN